MENIEQLEPERHTEEIQDIITKVPSWVIRRGIMVFFGVLLIVTIISVIVRYPDVVKSRIRFQPIEKDSYISSPQAAVIKQTKITQYANVKQGQLLAVIQTADGKDIDLKSPIDGKIGFATIIQTETTVLPQQPLFVIHPNNQHYFGLMQVPVNISNRLKPGQRVLIFIGDKNNLGADEIQGKIIALTDEPDKNGIITIKVMINANNINLKNWMTGEAQIMTKDLSVGERIWNSVAKKM